MKISLNWLKDFIEFDNSANEIAAILASRGFPVEETEQLEDDTMLNVEVTSNRSDCLCHLGIARELAAALNIPLRLPEVKIDESTAAADELISVEIKNSQACGRYTARVIQEVQVGSTPDWMRKRLETVGVRSVNNIVDATNYAMMEIGQPPHAFDYDKIQGHKIIVRNAAKGETIVSIDGTKCSLDETMLIIADQNQPVAVAGVMGGLDTEISEDTKNVLLEEAWFAPLCIRSTARKLNLMSESSYRFERNVDIAVIEWASQRTAQLIVQVAGGKIAKSVVDVFPAGYQPKKTFMRLSRLKKLLGIEIPVDQVLQILTSLGFNPKIQDDAVCCDIPSWRSRDTSREVDIIEEVIRSYGYNKIPTETKINIEVAAVDKNQSFSNKIRSYFNACGFYETVNVTFDDANGAGIFGISDIKSHFAVKDQLRKSANILRQSLMGSLMTVLKSNINSGNTGCRFYEIANTFEAKQGSDMPNEKMKIGLLIDGDYRIIRGAIEGFVKNINKMANLEFVPTEIKWAKSAAEIKVNSKAVGIIGIADPKTIDKYDMKNISPVLAELDYNSLFQLQQEKFVFKQLPKYPSIVRDLSIIVDEQVCWSDILSAVNSAKTTELEQISFVDIYRGKPIEKGKKSVTISLIFRDENGTLTHEQVDKMQQNIVDNFKKSLSATLRTV